MSAFGRQLPARGPGPDEEGDIVQATAEAGWNLIDRVLHELGEGGRRHGGRHGMGSQRVFRTKLWGSREIFKGVCFNVSSQVAGSEEETSH